ncbi:uncharacterized protein LOC143366389 isoform X2 [Andrena cerasifolii]|uniref:uncharacterized protein LOC143366389 isoform X2 n=1 Tax=Andrena cerasifolii TaxID=2819439 RepID=UPI004037B275
MWDLGHRAVVALVSVLSGCVFLYNVWGTILILTISLFLTIYACYSLIINDSLLSPHAFQLLHYCKHATLKVRLSLESVAGTVYRYTRIVWETACRRFREISLTQTRMDKHRGARYQISTNPYSPRKNSPRFSSIAHLSPIPDTSQRLDANDVKSENKFYHGSDHSLYDRSPFNKHTSTPMFQWNKDELENQPGKLLPSDRTSPKGISASYVRNHTLTRGENTTYFTLEGSPWGTSISPKVHPKMNEAKAAQTVSGPLLTSNRYNIDQKVYSDVTSPGLTARLTKYATEASNKLIHQSQYRVGQFPKVNLQASPVPLINAKSAKTRTPVTVRVAPPEKQKFLSDLYNAKGTCDSPLVALDSRELSLKRHASREDVASDLAKKQRTDSIVNTELEAQDEMKQKRSRESSKSEEDTSPQNKTARPMKRTKTPSCYDILNSLSSSKHVISGVKRKARDFSRSGTPDFEKHFKSLECVQSTRIQTPPETRNVTAKYWSPDVMEKSNSVVRNSPDIAQQQSPLKGILKTSNKSLESSSRDKDNEVHGNFTDAYNGNDQSTESVASSADESAKLTNKLFMRAEPERNQKLRMLVEEQGNIRAKFTTDDVDEIKKEDIADMRQTSMKARLQSMFDAISGRGNRINPDVVIQAEELNAVKSLSSPVTCVTLNSSTITTNANTTPISTSAVAPSPPGTNKSDTKSPKHVAFNLPGKEIPSDSNVSGTRAETLSIPKPDSTPIKPAIRFTTTSGIAPVPSAPSPIITSSKLNVPNVDFAKAASPTVTNASSSGTFTFRAVSSNEKATTSTTPQLTTSTSTDLFGSVTGSMAKTTPLLITSGLTDTKSEVNRNNSPIALLPAGNVSSSPSLGTFGAGTVTVSPANVNAVTPTITSVVENTGQYSGVASVNSNLSASASAIASTSTSPITSAIPFKSIASAGSSSFSTITPANTSAAPLFSFGNKTMNSQASKPEPFVFGSAGTASQSTNAFESLTNSQQASTTSSAIANKNATFSQNSGTPNTASSSAFASNAKATVSPFGSSTTSFSFGTSTHPASSNGRPGFSFGTTTSTTNPLTGTSNTTVFGTEKNHPSSTFVTSPDNSTAQFRPAASSIFGNASSGPSIFGTANSQPAVGAPSTVSTTAASFATVPPKSVAAPGFGSNAATTFTGSKSTNSATVFSNTTGGSSLGISATTSTPIFGSIPITSAPGVIGTSGNLFSNANSTTPITSTTSASSFRPAGNIFGQAKAPAANFKSATEVFGNNPGSLFGSQATTTTTTAVFGGTNVSSNATTTFGSTNASSNVTVPTFGPTSTAPSAFGSKSNPAYGSSSSMFGTENLSTPVFGTSIGNGPFNPPVSSTTFGGQNATSLAFGAPKSLVAFGDNKPSPFAPQTSAFGTPVTPAPTFGTSNATTATNNTSNIFTFGANQKPPQQNTTAFSFGSNASTNNSSSSNNNNNSSNNNNNNTNNNAAGSTSTPFQFGATTSKPATGFNFTTPTTTPSINFGTTSSPPFNAAAPGMFNIGSGSTAPRSRNVRTRKPR